METRIQTDLVAAMKEKNADKTTALREIKTAIMRYKTAPGYKGTCTDDDVVSIIQKLVKQHEEAAGIFEAAGRTELVQEEIAQMSYMKDYLPKMLDNVELAASIDAFITENTISTMKDMGKVMAYLKTTYPNQYDAKYASTYIKSKLS